MTKRCASGRRRWWGVLGVGLAWVASAAGPLAAGGPREEAIRWPENVHLVQAVLTRESLLAIRSELDQREVLDLPQLRAYDRLGRPLLALEGFDRAAFADQLAPVLARRAKPLPGLPLIADLEKLETPDGGRIQGLPASHLTLVALTLQGSRTCRDQARELARLAAREPNLRINMIQADVALERFEVAPWPADAWSWPAWPANVRKVAAQLTRKALAESFLGLPQLRIYDRAGRQILWMRYDQRFDYKREVSAVLLGRARPAAGAPAVGTELALLQTSAGAPVPRLPPADLTVVLYWAEECFSCRQVAQDLARRFAAQPALRANLLFVEADWRKRS